MQQLWSSSRIPHSTNSPHRKDEDDPRNNPILKDSMLTQDTAIDESFKSCRSSTTINDGDDDENLRERLLTGGDIDTADFHRFLTGGSANCHHGGNNATHHDEKKRSHSVHSNFLRSNNDNKKNGFNQRGSYIDYLAEMDGWSLVELLNNYGEDGNNVDEAACNNITKILDVWEKIARQIDEDDDSEFCYMIAYKAQLYRIFHLI